MPLYLRGRDSTQGRFTRVCGLGWRRGGGRPEGTLVFLVHDLVEAPVPAGVGRAQAQLARTDPEALPSLAGQQDVGALAQVLLADRLQLVVHLEPGDDQIDVYLLALDVGIIGIEVRTP